MSPFILTKDGTSRGGAKKHLGAPESFFLAATAFGTVLIVAAVGCALTGSRPTLYAAVAAPCCGGGYLANEAAAARQARRGAGAPSVRRRFSRVDPREA